MNAPSLEPIKLYLRSYRRRVAVDPADAERITRSLDSIRDAAVAAGDQQLAKLTWCLRRTLEVQHRYLRAFAHLKDCEFYEAWCLLEGAEVGLIALTRHFPDPRDEYGLSFIESYVSQFQGLFPYHLFTSPAMVHGETTCSICQQPITIRRRCEHIVGEIYDGELCSRMIRPAAILEISLVTNPVHKANVMFLTDPKTKERIDHYDYSLIAAVVRQLASPFDKWSAEWGQRRAPHSKFKNVGRNEKCPCRSGKKYKLCCLPHEGVLQPHVHIEFEAHHRFIDAFASRRSIHPED